MMLQSDMSYAAQIVATVSQPIVVLTDDLEVELVNDAFCRAFQVTKEESQRRRLYDLGNRQWDIPELRALLQAVVNKRQSLNDYRVEHDFEGIGKRVMLLNARHMDRAEGERVVLAINDITQSERQLFELEGRKEFAEKLIDSIRESLLILDWDLRVQSANKSFYDHFHVSPEATEGRLVYDLGNGQWQIPELRELLENVLPEKSSFNDFEVEHDFESIGPRVMSLNGRRLDHLNLIILAIRDITERRQKERRQVAFMGEMQHRVKNILNNVHALTSQTRRRCTDLDQFIDAFVPRLSALARAQDLLMKSPQDSVEVAEIVCVELEAVGAERGTTYSVDGPPVRLKPRDVQAFAMAVHELATNAGKYGALKERQGRVHVEWKIVDDGQKEFRFRWHELGVRIDNKRIERGLGTDVIEKSVPHMLGGSVEFKLNPDGADCRISFPLSRTT